MGIYIFKPYNSAFPELFEKEKKRLQTFLKKDCQIEHIGSTAVPNLGGKGIIDICIVVPDKDRGGVWKALIEAGYKIRPNYTPNMHVSHTIYLSDLIEGERKYQIHIQKPGSLRFKEVLAFRDYLRKHPADVKRYADIKKKAAEEASEDRDKYLSIKGPIIDAVLKKALDELNKA